MRLKLEDIGRMAGVSRSTVSRVVNNEDSVRPEVRERVQDVIRRTGYTPHVAARSLVSNRTGVIGLVIPSRVHNLFEDPYFARLIQGVTAASNESGTTLSLAFFYLGSRSSSTPARHGRTPGSRASTAGSATSCSTCGSSTASSKPG